MSTDLNATVTVYADGSFAPDTGAGAVGILITVEKRTASRIPVELHAYEYWQKLPGNFGSPVDVEIKAQRIAADVLRSLNLDHEQASPILNDCFRAVFQCHRKMGLNSYCISTLPGKKKSWCAGLNRADSLAKKGLRSSDHELHQARRSWTEINAFRYPFEFGFKPDHFNSRRKYRGAKATPLAQVMRSPQPSHETQYLDEHVTPEMILPIEELLEHNVHRSSSYATRHILIRELGKKCGEQAHLVYEVLNLVDLDRRYCLNWKFDRIKRRKFFGKQAAWETLKQTVNLRNPQITQGIEDLLRVGLLKPCKLGYIVRNHEGFANEYLNRIETDPVKLLSDAKDRQVYRIGRVTTPAINAAVSQAESNRKFQEECRNNFVFTIQAVKQLDGRVLRFPRCKNDMKRLWVAALHETFSDRPARKGLKLKKPLQLGVHRACDLADISRDAHMTAVNLYLKTKHSYQTIGSMSPAQLQACQEHLGMRIRGRRCSRKKNRFANTIDCINVLCNRYEMKPLTDEATGEPYLPLILNERQAFRHSFRAALKKHTTYDRATKQRSLKATCPEWLKVILRRKQWTPKSQKEALEQQFKNANLNKYTKQTLISSLSNREIQGDDLVRITLSGNIPKLRRLQRAQRLAEAVKHDRSQLSRISQILDGDASPSEKLSAMSRHHQAQGDCREFWKMVDGFQEIEHRRMEVFEESCQLQQSDFAEFDREVFRDEFESNCNFLAGLLKRTNDSKSSVSIARLR